MGASELIFLGKTIPKIVKIFGLRPPRGAAGQVLTLDGRRRLVLGGSKLFWAKIAPTPVI